MGVVHKPDPGWASFIPVLIKCLELTDGPVLELGVGYFSTPLLHALCAAKDRFLLSVESELQFVELFKRFKNEESPKHRILHYQWDELYLPMLNPTAASDDWSLVFVDQKPAEARKEMIKQVVNADYVVIHDSNDPIYDYESIYPLFKYKFTHEYLQHTTVLSNKHDVSNIFRNS